MVLLAVVQDMKLYNPGAVHMIAVSAGLYLVSSEIYPDAGNTACHLPQNPFLSHGNLVKPLTMFFNVLIYHCKKLRHSRSCVRIGELGADGLGKGALLRPEGIPDCYVRRINTAQEKNQASYTSYNHLGIIHALPAIRALLKLDPRIQHTAGPQNQHKYGDSKGG